MVSLIRLIEQISPLLYMVFLVGVLWSIRNAWVARREGDTTLFSLERETASARVWRAFLTVLGFILLGLIVFFVSNYVVPTLPDEEVLTPTLSGPFVTQTPTSTPFPTPTFENTATSSDPQPESTAAPDAPVESPTPEPTPIPLAPRSCPDPNVQITAPRNGLTFSGPFQIFGTANIPNFAFYKFDISGPATNFQFRTTGDDVVRTPVGDGYLYEIDPIGLLQSPGEYRLSLVAVDNVGNEAPHCTITVFIVAAVSEPD